MKRHFFAVALWFALPAFCAEAASLDARGLQPVPGISPGTLALGSAGQCVKVVSVTDPHAACERYRCEMVFPSRRVKKLNVGDRALLVEACEEPHERDTGSLLWGSQSVLVLQSERSGSGLWAQSGGKKSPTITLETEASSGTLSVTKQGFRWKESP